MTKKTLNLLVGDNPFHGISHLSQARARARNAVQNHGYTEHAAHLVEVCFENGADGFMFSVDEATLSIIRSLCKNAKNYPVSLYAIAPYAYEYVRKATQTGGVSGLTRDLTREMVFSSNVRVLALNMGSLLRFDLSAYLKMYVAYELSRIKAVGGESVRLKSFMLHEIITDMALALNMEQLFKSYIGFLGKYHVRPGFETRNFPYLVSKFLEWKIDLSKLTLTSAFNKVGFQMCPSKAECEEALKHVEGAEVIAMSVLAAGYLKPMEAIGYLASLKSISGAVIGVSREYQATQTFRVFRDNFELNSGYVPK